MKFTIENGVLKNGVRGMGEDTAVIPEGVTAIADNAFWGWGTLRTVWMPDSVTEIGEAVFSNCENLTEVRLPEGLTRIGLLTFRACKSLRTIRIPDSVTEIGNDAFSGCITLEKVTFPAGLKHIGDRAFYGCERLQAADLPAGVKRIGNEAFCGCRKMETLTLPDGMEKIGEMAFRDCSSLREVTFPESITEIGSNAFAICGKLERIIIPEQVAAGARERVFSFCTAIRCLKLHPDDPEIRWDFVLFDLDRTLSLAPQFFLQKPPLGQEICLYAILRYLRTHDAVSSWFVRKNLQKILQESIRNGDTVFLADIADRTDWITAEMIDGLLDLALQGAHREAFAVLLTYKNEKLGFRNAEDYFNL